MKIGICGYGVIGSGVKKLIDEKHQNNEDLEVIKVFDKPFKKDELKELYVNDYKEITENKDIDIVVEAMGGDKFPYEIIKDALKNKKHVVTSNKEVVSLHLDEFNSLAKENNVYFMFEASVGGGIPIINSLIQNRKVNEINHIYGILNGTTNFILTKIEEGLSFDDALKEAQRLGFAEADPTADLEGLDMVRKISILSDIAYNTFIDVNKVEHRGIKGITKEFIEKANKNGLVLKFICESKIKDNYVSLIVEPVLFKKDNIISNTKNEFNCVIFEGKSNDKLAFVGKGAGSLPTASAILSDIYLIKDNNANYLDLSKKVVYCEKNDNDYLELCDDGTFKKAKKEKFYARVFME